MFWILGSDFGFWEVFLDSGKCFWILRSVFGFWEVFWILGSVLDSGKCFVPMGHHRNQSGVKFPLDSCRLCGATMFTRISFSSEIVGIFSKSKQLQCDII